MKGVDQKIVVVTRPTQMAALRRRFQTRSQAKFQIVSAKKRELAQAATATPAQAEKIAEADFDLLERASASYDATVSQLRGDLEFDDLGLPVQMVDRDFLPNFVFGPRDVVVTVGQDGIVANTAKYAIGLPIVAVNPDPGRIDGVLLPFRAEQARSAVRDVLNGRAKMREVTLAEARLGDGQRLLAFNELFLGSRTHVSARYRIGLGSASEAQSSSGVLVCTGAGSTGWLSSVFNMMQSVGTLAGQTIGAASIKLPWEDPRLVFVVREPFASKSSAIKLTAGVLQAGQTLSLESEMAADGVIFSDGVESDYLEFNAGAIVHVSTAKGKAKLVTP